MNENLKENFLHETVLLALKANELKKDRKRMSPINKLWTASNSLIRYFYLKNICYYFNYKEYKRYIYANEVYKISENIARRYPELI